VLVPPKICSTFCNSVADLFYRNSMLFPQYEAAKFSRTKSSPSAIGKRGFLT
jgi:hypothetical protein